MDLAQAERMLEVYSQTQWTDTPVLYPSTLPVDAADPSQMLVPEGDSDYVALRYLFDHSQFITVPGTLRRVSGQVQVSINIRTGNNSVAMRTYASKVMDLFEGKELKEGTEVLRLWGMISSREYRPVGWHVRELIFGVSFERAVP